MAELSLIVKFLDELLQPSLYADSCPNGLQCEGKPHVLRIAAAVSATVTTIEEAVRRQVDLLLVHHGLFWKGDDQRVVAALQRKLKLLLTNEISVVAYHLPLDAHPLHGNNWGAAAALGWEACRPFGLYQGRPIGVGGSFSPRTREALRYQLESYYNHPAAIAYGGKEVVSSAALISGGAHRMIREAAAEGYDCFITGTSDEPVWHWAREEGVGINFFALGHSATERLGVQAIAKELASHFSIEQSFILDDNPF